MENINSGIDPSALMTQLSGRLDSVRRSRVEIGQELISIEASLAEFLGSIDAANTKLRELKKGTKAAPAAAPAMSLDDFKIYIEKILQGSLEAVGDKISDRIVNMLSELKGLGGAAREAKIREIKETADSEMIDLSMLFQEKVESNIEEIGIKEQEASGIDRSLQKLRKIIRKIKGDDKDAGTPDKKNT